MFRSDSALVVAVLGLAVAGCGGKERTPASGAAAAATSGSLTQLDGMDGCISDTGTAGECADGNGLDGASGVALSADGKSVYVASTISDAVAAFSRTPTSGQAIQLPSTAGCVSQTGTSGACTDGKALDQASYIAVSPDGKNAYVTSSLDHAVAVFERNTSSGKLIQLAGIAGCVSENGSGPCADGKALTGARSVAVSSDGKHVYVASLFSDAVVVFVRHLPTGQLRQVSGASGLAGCVSETGSGPCVNGKALDAARAVAVSPDGKNVYVASELSDAIAVFARDATTGSLTQLPGSAGCASETGSGPCADGKALDSPWSVAVSPDGRHVYVVSLLSGAVAVFRRNTSSGKLTQLAGTAGCVSATGAGGCADGQALHLSMAVAVSADGKHVYIGSNEAIAVFDRDVTTGKLTQLAGTDACVSETGSGGACADGKALREAFSVAVSLDGKYVHVASYTSRALAVFARNP